METWQSRTTTVVRCSTRYCDWTGPLETAPGQYNCNPNSQNAYINRGLSLRRLGRYVPAIADYSKAVSLEPKLVPAYGNRAYAKYRLAAFESASSDYEAAIELAPRVPVLHGGLGIVRFAQERFDDATKHFSDANRLDRSSLYWPLWHYLAARRAGHGGASLPITAARSLYCSATRTKAKCWRRAGADERYLPTHSAARVAKPIILGG